CGGAQKIIPGDRRSHLSRAHARPRAPRRPPSSSARPPPPAGDGRKKEPTKKNHHRAGGWRLPRARGFDSAMVNAAPLKSRFYNELVPPCLIFAAAPKIRARTRR